MRLLFISTVYPTPWHPDKGPANRSTVESLRAIGCEVRIVGPVPWLDRYRNQKQTAPPGEFPTYWYTPAILRRYYHFPLWYSVRSTLRRVTAEFKPDAVLAFWAHPDGTVAVRYAEEQNIPCGIIVGGSDVMLLPQSPARRRIVARTLQHCDHVFAVGKELQRRVNALGVPENRITNFFCGVDLSAFVPGEKTTARKALNLPEQGPLLLWIGQMVGVKAVHRLINAASHLLDKHPDLQVALVGDGPERHALMQLANDDVQLRGRVHFPGAVDHSMLPHWYRAADLFVLPSISEGVPNVLLESMAMGVPFVASDVGSIADLLPCGPSQVVPEGNLEALTTGIDDLLTRENPETIPPRRYDRLDGARHLVEHLQRKAT